MVRMVVLRFSSAAALALPMSALAGPVDTADTGWAGEVQSAVTEEGDGTVGEEHGMGTEGVLAPAVLPVGAHLVDGGRRMMLGLDANDVPTEPVQQGAYTWTYVGQAEFLWQGEDFSAAHFLEKKRERFGAWTTRRSTSGWAPPPRSTLSAESGS